MLRNLQINNTIGDNSILSGRDTNINVVNILQGNAITLLESVPQVDVSYIERREAEEYIISQIEKFNIIQLYGISGIGKTELVKKIVNSIKNDFQKVYWISSNNVNEIELENIVTVSGVKINLIEKLESQKVIIVIDNYWKQLDKMAQKFLNFNYKGSKLIFTSQERTSSDTIKKISIDFMTNEEAYKIFINEKCKEFETEEFKNFLLKLDKHPMMLQILKAYLLDEENGISLSDFKSRLHFVQLEDSDISQSSKICEKIIGAYYANSKQVYNFLQLVNSNIIEENFLKSIILADIPSLIKKSFLKHNQDHYYIHNIVLDSIDAIIKKNNIKSNKIPYQDEIIKYLENKIDERNIKYYRFVAYNIDFLKRLYNIIDNQYLRILIYNVFVDFSKDYDAELHIKNINSLLEQADLTKFYAIKLLIELYELKVRGIDKNNIEERNEFIDSCIKELEKLKEDIKKYRKVLQLTDHHIAKLYNWNGEYDKAIDILKKIIKINPKAYKSILQLCRAYREKIIIAKNNDDKELADKYLSNTFEILSSLDYGNISISVFLELVSLVTNRPLNDKKILDVCLWNNFELFSKSVMLYSKNKIFEHIYLIMGDLASTLSYNRKDFYKEWFKEIEHPDFNESSRELSLAIIKIYCAEIKRRKYSNEEYEELVIELDNYWTTYKKKYISALKKSKKDFVFKPIIEIYIETNKIEYAKEELKEIYDESNEWHIKFESSILKGLGELNSAKEKIEKAIKIYEKKDDHKYIAAFYKDYAEVLYDMNDKKCIEKLKNAISMCDNDKTKNAWNRKLNDWINQF